MSADWFVVAETGGSPTYLFTSLQQAEDVLGTEFLPDGDGVLRSGNDVWTGWSLSLAAAVALLYGGPRLRLVEATGVASDAA